MARNPNVIKMKRQKFRKHRGNFKPFSDPSSNDETFINPSLRQFWSDKVSPRSSKQGTSGNNRAHIPENQLGYFNIRGHAAYRPEHREDNSNPATIYFLHTIFPGAKFVSTQRELALQAMRDVLLAPTQPELHFVMWRSRYSCLRLYFSLDKTCWWFVLQERNILKSSFTYGSKDRAMAVCETQTIRWKIVRTLPPNSS